MRCLVKNSGSGEKGISLMEVLLTILILGIILSGVVMTASTASRSLVVTDREEAARNYAQYLMEYLKNVSYQGGITSYDLPAPPDIYQGYSAGNTVTELATGKQKITITITYDNKTIYTLEGYKIQ